MSKLLGRGLALAATMAAACVAGPADATILWGATAFAGANQADLSVHPWEVLDDYVYAGGSYVETASAVAVAGRSWAMSFASIGDGILRVSGMAAKPPMAAPGATCCANSGSLASASIIDVFHFQTAEIGRIVPWEITIDGSLSGLPGYRNAMVEWSFDGWNTEHQEFFGGEMTIGGELVLAQGETDFPILVRITGGAGSGSADILGDAAYDLSHTAHFHVFTPAGVAASSASGLFRFTPAGAAPEPAAWSLMVAGLGLAGMELRRRRPALA